MGDDEGLSNGEVGFAASENGESDAGGSRWTKARSDAIEVILALGELRSGPSAVCPPGYKFFRFSFDGFVGWFKAQCFSEVCEDDVRIAVHPELSMASPAPVSASFNFPNQSHA